MIKETDLVDLDQCCDALSKRCPNRPGHVAHEHGVCQGHSVTSHAGRYTKEMAQAIHAGFVKTLRRKDPSHVVKILKKLWKIAGKGEQDRLSHWTDDRLVKAVDRYQKCCKGSGSYVYVNDHGDTAVYEPGETLAEGVSFEVPEGRQLDDGARAVLRKLHSNLGHPSALDLKRFMRSAGAPQELVEAIGWLRCAAHAKTQRPRSHRVARIPPHDIQFNDQLMVDCFYLKDVKHQGHWFMSVLDRSTMYHQVTLIPNHSPEAFVKVFHEYWAKWAGRPLEVSIDLDRGFGSKRFAEAVGEGGTHVAPIAGQAHWQHGKVERHGIKDTLAKVLTQADAHGVEAVGWAANEVTHCKTALIREHGFSPGHALLGW